MSESRIRSRRSLAHISSIADAAVTRKNAIVKGGNSEPSLTAIFVSPGRWIPKQGTRLKDAPVLFGRVFFCRSFPIPAFLDFTRQVSARVRQPQRHGDTEGPRMLKRVQE
jgi:hypothetical protein